MPLRDGWSHFAAQIIRALRDYDEENSTGYATAFDVSAHGPSVLAEIMRKVDRENKWEPVPQQQAKASARKGLN